MGVATRDGSAIASGSTCVARAPATPPVTEGGGAPRARGAQRRQAHRRRLAAIAALAVLGALGVGAVAALPHDDGESYITGFDLADGRTAQGLNRLRHERNLAVVVHGGLCVDGGQRRPPRRVERVQRQESHDAVAVALKITDGDNCAGVEDDLTTTVWLPTPIGDRALITDASPYQFRLILIPPTNRAAVRRLVVGRGRDHNGSAAFRYFGPACDFVAPYLSDIPEKDWCFD
jgi:hypothetical protein